MNKIQKAKNCVERARGLHDAYKGQTLPKAVASEIENLLSESKSLREEWESEPQRMGLHMGQDEGKSYDIAGNVYGGSEPVNFSSKSAKEFGAFLVSGERKDLTVTEDGDILAAPEFSRTALLERDLVSPFRKVTRVEKVGGKERHVPILGAVTSDWTAEGLASHDADSVPSEVVLVPSKHTCQVRYTEEMGSDGHTPLLRDLSLLAGQQFAKAEAAAFVNGTGSGQPEGILTAAASGGYARVTTATGETALTGDHLLDLLAALPPQFLAPHNAWVLSPATLGQIRKFVAGGSGEYLNVYNPDTGKLLGYDVVLSEDIADAAAGAECVAFGDFKRAYLIGDRLSIGARVFDHELPTSGKWLARFVARVDGRIADSNAARILALAAT